MLRKKQVSDKSLVLKKLRMRDFLLINVDSMLTKRDTS